MDLQQLCIQIEAKGGGTVSEQNFLVINMLPSSLLPILFVADTKFDANTVGLGLGIVWGALLVFFGLIATVTGLGTGLVELLGSVHIGYKATVLGSVIGGICGLVYGFICGAIIARAYNLLLAKDTNA
ncbi:MAG: hypothetical protein ACE5IC_08960 [Candidatus Brocadiales bacterium]